MASTSGEQSEGVKRSGSNESSGEQHSTVRLDGVSDVVRESEKETRLLSSTLPPSSSTSGCSCRSPSTSDSHCCLLEERPVLSVVASMSGEQSGGVKRCSSDLSSEQHSSAKRLKLDSTSGVVREDGEGERQFLLSEIHALRSELETKKEQLLLKRDETAKDNHSLSMLSTMQKEFTCVICQELFISAHTLPCAHSFCEWCIKEWTKCQKKNDCPICRKRITTDPVHSLALDNAIDKIVEKLDSDAREERKRLKRTHEESLRKIPATTAVSRSGRRREDWSTESDSEYSEDYYSDDDYDSEDSEYWYNSEEYDYDSEFDDYDSEFDDSSDYSDSYIEGYPGTYYGGYGRCFNCGQCWMY